jgi:hypothetical protein
VGLAILLRFLLRILVLNSLDLARALWNFDEFGPSHTANEVVKAMQSVLDGTYRKVGSSGPHLALNYQAC